MIALRIHMSKYQRLIGEKSRKAALANKKKTKCAVCLSAPARNGMGEKM